MAAIGLVGAPHDPEMTLRDSGCLLQKALPGHYGHYEHYGQLRHRREAREGEGTRREEETGTHCSKQLVEHEAVPNKD